MDSSEMFLTVQEIKNVDNLKTSLKYIKNINYWK